MCILSLMGSGDFTGCRVISALGAPSIGHILALFVLIGLWKFPRTAHAFDPDPRQTSPNSQTSPTMNPPPPPPPLPLARRTSSEWESESTISCDSDRSSEPLSCPGKQNPTEPSGFLKSGAPESTLAERHRFLVARNGDEAKALENLIKYLTWRKTYQALIQEQEQRHYNLQTKESDAFDWIVASQAALQANNDPALGWKWLPRIVRTHVTPNGQEAVDRHGCRILHIMPAMIDDHICSLSVYSLALALYLDRKVQREAAEKITLLVDLRPGEGWRNISAVRLIPFIKDIASLLLTMFPERLEKTILFPLPFALTWVFSAVKVVIDPVTAEKIHVLSGAANVKSPLPFDQLKQHVSSEVALICENERLMSFSA
jgi:CRAL/TRIO domain